MSNNVRNINMSASVLTVLLGAYVNWVFIQWGWF